MLALLLVPILSTATVSTDTARVPPPIRARAEIRVPRIQPGSKELQHTLDHFYDRAAASAASALPHAGTTDATAGEGITDPLQEPPFDATWDSLTLSEAASRFDKDETTTTGLSEDAPEALRWLANRIYEHKGGKASFNELTRELKLIAGLKDEQKFAFVSQLRSPMPVYVSLAASHATHSLEARAEVQRMTALLGKSGLTISDFIAAKDSEERFAASFILRAHSYDALIPYLKTRPEEGKAIARYLFSEKRPEVIRDRAAVIESFAVQLAAYDRKAFDRFGVGLLEQAEDKDSKVARRAALLLKLNESLWPRYAARIDAAAADLPPALFDDPRLVPATPYPFWPKDHIKVTLHFAAQPKEALKPGESTSYAEWLAFFKARGFAIGTLGPDGVEMIKTIDGVTLALVAKVYTGDEEGFLVGKEKERFLADIQHDLRDPEVQGVAARSHAQFFFPAMFGKSVTKGKFWFDGACRGSWYAEDLEKRCPTCSAAGNSGTGRGQVNDKALLAILEGLVRREEWEAIGKDLKTALPAANSRFFGPWTPRYHTALDLLKKYPPVVNPAGTSR